MGEKKGEKMTGLTNLILIAGGILLGGAMMSPQYESVDIFVVLMWIFGLGLIFGAFAIQIRTEIKELRYGPIEAPKPWPRTQKPPPRKIG